MTAIGGKTKQRKPTQPQWVVQIADGVNEFALLSLGDKNETLLNWVGDPNAATKFNSKFEAKARVREMEDVPDTRCFKELEQKKK